MLNNPMWLVAAILDGTDIEHFQHHGKFYQIVYVLDAIINSLTHQSI